MRKLLHEGSGHLKEARRWHDEGNAGGISRDEEAFASLNDAISVYRKMRVLACKMRLRKLGVEQLWTETLGARAVAGGTPLIRVWGRPVTGILRFRGGSRILMQIGWWRRRSGVVEKSVIKTRACLRSCMGA